MTTPASLPKSDMASMGSAIAAWMDWIDEPSRRFTTATAPSAAVLVRAQACYLNSFTRWQPT